jgi:hypothetical protein
MKVLNLRCANDHRFEGWFGSDDDFTSQRERELIACPTCDDATIERLPSAPRLNVSASRDIAPPADQAVAQVQRRWLHAMREMVAGTEDVGERFPEEARRIHYGEAEQRGIRGQASAADADALRDEGIEVVAIPLPQALKKPLQ